jgi:ComEC/Rec2-related protein
MSTLPRMRLLAVLKAALNSWLDTERERLALWLPVFMGAGVLAYYTLRFEPAPWVGAAAAVPAIGLAVCLPGLRWLIAPLAAAALGFTLGQIATARAPPIEVDLPTHASIVTGTIRAVEPLPEGRRITILPAWIDGAPEPLRRSVRIRLQKKDDGDLGSGDSVRIRALIRPPALPSYPGAWDLQRDAFYSGLGASGYALATAERTTQAVPSGPMGFVQWLREGIARRVVAVIPGAAGAVSVTLLTGSSMAIPEPDHAAFRDFGLAHLLAVAGLHIGIVMGFALAISRFGFTLSEHASLFWQTKKLSAICALTTGGAYMVLTGMHVPIIRSFAMACLLTIAILADRRPVSVRGLALAATALMVISPQDVPNVSFQMSFSAVLALIAGYEAPASLASPLAWRELAPAVRLASGRSRADQRAGGVRLRAVWRLSFRSCSGLFRPGQHDRRAADRAVGDAGRADRAVADAAASGGAGSDADGLGRAGRGLGGASDLRIAGRDNHRSAHSGLGTLRVLRRTCLARAVENAAATFGRGGDAGRIGLAGAGPPARSAGLGRRAVDRGADQARRVPATDARRIKICPRRLGPILGGGRVSSDAKRLGRGGNSDDRRGGPW